MEKEFAGDFVDQHAAMFMKGNLGYPNIKPVTHPILELAGASQPFLLDNHGIPATPVTFSKMELAPANLQNQSKSVPHTKALIVTGFPEIPSQFQWDRYDQSFYQRILGWCRMVGSDFQY